MTEQTERREGRFLTLTDRWRESMGMDHRTFARFLAPSVEQHNAYEVDWSLFRSRKRRLTRRFIAAVITKAPEPWKSALEKAHLADLTRDAEAVPA